MNDILTLIAKKHLNLETLDTRNNDELDFSDQSVWGIKAALQEALPKRWASLGAVCPQAQRHARSDRRRQRRRWPRRFCPHC